MANRISYPSSPIVPNCVLLSAMQDALAAFLEVLDGGTIADLTLLLRAALEPDDYERRQIHLPETRNGDPRTFPQNSVALTALRELHGQGKMLRLVPVFPSARSGESLQGSRGCFPSALKEAKI